MLRIHLFGRLRLFQGDQPLQFTAPPKTLPLLAYLLLHRADQIPRDRLAFTLWPDVSETAARGNLRRHLHELRRVLPPAPPGRPWLLTDRADTRWNPEADYWLDVAEFERLSGQPEALAEAVELVEDDLLPDLYDDWVFFERERLRNAWLATAGRLVEQRRERGDLAAAIHYTRLILQRDPLREETLRDLIVLRHEAGDRAGALLEYRRFEERLREELGVAPLPETQEVYERLKDEGGRQIGSAIPPSAFRLPPLPHNLPAQLTTFLGRAEELEAIRGLLAPPGEAPAPGARLLTLTGPGGAGKTRLAVEAAARLAGQAPGRFPDGVFFVPLSDIASPDFVAAEIAKSLNLVETGGQSLAERLQEFLRPRQSLLVLDNFEHVVEAAPLVGQLLAAAPGLRALVTSRVALHVYGEHEFPVSPLPLPDLERLPAVADLQAYPAIALFVERARAVRPDFDLTADNAAAVAEICVRLDGLPLAIELAAARSKLLPPQAMLARLSSRLAFLAGGARPRGLAARQQTLRQTIDWSYHLLAEEEKQLFAWLGVFAGGFGAEAAEAVTKAEGGGRKDGVSAFTFQPSAFEDVLASLVDQSMLRQEVDADGEPRFRLLFTLREYALERLAASGELAQARDRHARYYLALAEQAAPELTGARQASRLRQLLSVQDNLRAVLEWSQADAGDAELGLRLAIALGDFWYRRSGFREGRRWLQGALDACPAAPAQLRASALDFLGAIARDQADYAAARTALLESEALWRSLGEAGKPGLAWTLRNLGMVAYQEHSLAEAERYQTASLALHRETGNSLGVAASLSSLSTIATARQQTERAIAYSRESLPLALAAGDQQLVGDVLNNLGIAEQGQGNLAEARVHLAEALEAYRAVGDRFGQAIALNNLSNAARPQGDLAAARAYAEESAALYREVGVPAKSGRPLYHLGAAALLQGDLSVAADCFTESLTIHLEHSFADGALEAVEGFARLALAHSQPDRAARLLAAATALRQAHGAPLRTVPTLAEHEQTLAAIQAALPPEDFAAAWQAGSALSLDAAAALALGRSPPP